MELDPDLIPTAFRRDDYGLYEKLINLHPKVCENKREMLEITLHTRRSMGESLPPYEVIAKGVIAAVINYARYRSCDAHTACSWFGARLLIVLNCDVFRPSH